MLPNLREILVDINFDTDGDRRARRNIEKVQDELDDLNRLVTDGGEDMDEYGRALDRASDQLDDIADSFGTVDDSVDDNRESFSTLRKKVNLLTEELDDNQRELINTAGGADELADKFRDLREAGKKAREESIGYSKEQSYNNPFNEFIDDTERAIQMLEDLDDTDDPIPHIDPPSPKSGSGGIRSSDDDWVVDMSSGEGSDVSDAVDDLSSSISDHTEEIDDFTDRIGRDVDRDLAGTGLAQIMAGRGLSNVEGSLLGSKVARRELDFDVDPDVLMQILTETFGEDLEGGTVGDALEEIKSGGSLERSIAKQFEEGGLNKRTLRREFFPDDARKTSSIRKISSSLVPLDKRFAPLGGDDIGEGETDEVVGLIQATLSDFNSTDELDESTVKSRLTKYVKGGLSNRGINTDGFTTDDIRDGPRDSGTMALEFFEKLFTEDIDDGVLEDILDNGLPTKTAGGDKVGDYGRTEIDKDALAQRIGVPTDKEITQQTKGNVFESFQEFSSELLDTDANQDASRTDIADFIGDIDKDSTITQQNILADAVERLRGSGDDDDPNTPLTTETLRMGLWERFVEEDSDVARRMITDIERKLERGKFNLPSVAETGVFDNLFKPEFEQRLLSTDIPNSEAEGLAESLTNSISNAFASENNDATFLTDLVEDDKLLNQVIDDAVSGMDGLVEDSERAEEVTENINREMQSIVSGTEKASDRVQRMVEGRAAPNTRLAMYDDVQPFLGGDVDLLGGDDPDDAQDRIRGVANAIESTQENFIAFGGLGIDGVFARAFNFVDKDGGKIGDKLGIIGDALGFTATSALDVDSALKTVNRGMKRMIPTLGAVSLNLGALNVGLRNLAGVLYGMAALIGPFITMLGGLATALLTAGAALGAFVAVGGITFLEQMVSQMAGVNNKAEALQKLMQSLKREALEAVEPLRNVDVGGMSGPEAFVSTINHGLAMLNQLSRTFAQIVEMPEVAESMERLRNALFVDLDGSMISALKDSIELLLPILTDMLVYLIEKWPGLVRFMSKTAKVMSDSLGPAFVKLIPLLAVAIRFGSELIAMAARLATALLTVVNILPLQNKMFMNMIGAMGTLIGAYYAAITAVQILSFVTGSALVGSLLNAFVVLQAYNSGVSMKIALDNKGTMSTLWFAGAMSTLNNAFWSVTGSVWGYITSLEVSNTLTWLNTTATSALSASTWGLSSANVAATISTYGLATSLRVLKVALASTGIGLIVVLLGELAAQLLYNESILDNIAGTIDNVADKFGRMIDTVKQRAGEIIPVLQDVAAIFGLATNPQTVPGFAARVLTDGKGLDKQINLGQMANMINSPGSKAPTSQRANRSPTYNVYVQGEGGRKTGRDVGREVEKERRRRDRQNGWL